MTDELEHEDGIEEQPDDATYHNESPSDDIEVEVSMLRDLVFKAHPDVVRELIIGETLTDILASLEPARAAYERIAEQIEQDLHRERVENTFALAKAGARTEVDRGTMTTAERLRLGLRERSGNAR